MKLAVAFDDLARVHAHAHLQADGAAEVGAGESPLTGDRRIDRARRVVEDTDHTVAGVLHDAAAGAHDDLVQQRVVLVERGQHLVGKPVPQAGAALDVGEQERSTHRRR